MFELGTLCICCICAFIAGALAGESVTEKRYKKFIDEIFDDHSNALKTIVGICDKHNKEIKEIVTEFIENKKEKK